MVLPWIVLVVLVLLAALLSVRKIGPTEVGLVTKKFSLKKLANDNPVAFNGEAGYQADVLMPGLRWKPWLLYSVEKHPWVQVPAGEIGVVIAQVGQPLPIGAKSAVYKKEFANFSDLRSFVQQGGQKGVQRPVLPPGTLVPIHPVGFLVITRTEVYGLPVSPELRSKAGKDRKINPEAVGLRPDQLGSNATTLVNVIAALAEGRARFMPEVLVTSGGGSGALEGLAATAMRYINTVPRAEEEKSRDTA